LSKEEAQMKRWILSVLLLGVGGVAVAQQTDPYDSTPNVYVGTQQRGLFNSVRLNKDLPRKMCGGQEPLNVHVYHTTGDGFAAVLTGILWTPAHLKVTCPAPAPAQPTATR
jgi:hypothetical protein